MDTIVIINRLADIFADEMAKKNLRTLNSVKYKDAIEQTSWINLCAGKIPEIKVTKEIKAFHAEMHDLQLSIISKHKDTIFKE
jgi:hypothetical protein